MKLITSFTRSWRTSFAFLTRMNYNKNMQDIIKIREQTKKIAEKYDLKLVLLFGSRVKGNLHHESDFDISFLPAKKLTFEEETNLNYEFTNVFGSDRVDTVNLKSAPPLLLKQIIDNCFVLYENRPTVFSYFEAYARQRYQEAVPLFKIHRDYVRRFTSLPL